MNELHELIELYNHASELLRNKIISAQHDIHESQAAMLRWRSFPEICNPYREHINVLREYVAELKSQQEELHREYSLERLKIVQD